MNQNNFGSPEIAAPDELELKKTRSGNEAKRLSYSRRIIAALLILFSGWVMNWAYPPMNWSFLAWVALIPLYWIAVNGTVFQAWRCGYYWGLTWGFTTFFWLREINQVIPFLMAPVIALYPACWAASIPFFRRWLLLPVEVQLNGYEAEQQAPTPGLFRLMTLVFTLAGWWCVFDWLRCMMLPWNYLGNTQWQNLPIIQIAEFTGVYGITFLVVAVNIATAISIRICLEQRRRSEKVALPSIFFVTLSIVAAVLLYGCYLQAKHTGKGDIVFKAGLVQGDISQRRFATYEQAREALDVYLGLSMQLAQQRPDIIIWPETAIPYPFRGTHPLSVDYRNQIKNLIENNNIPMLVGTIDYVPNPFFKDAVPLTYNSAFQFDTSAKVVDRFDKIHLVPFGEYVPFRKYLPDAIIKIIDMNRDVTPGKKYTPLQILPGVKAGVGICFEDTISYIAGIEMQHGANLLLVVTNDAWYPKSSEPEQHLANAIFRSVETRLPMLICGNNCNSSLIKPNGFIAYDLTGNAAEKKLTPYVRGRKTGIIPVRLEENPPVTFYAAFGNVFVFASAMLAMVVFFYCAWQWREKKNKLQEFFKN